MPKKKAKIKLVPLEKVNKMGVLTGFPYFPYGAASVLSLKEAQKDLGLIVHGCFRTRGIVPLWKVEVSYTTIHSDAMIHVWFDLYQDPDGKLFAFLSNSKIPVAATAVYLESTDVEEGIA